MKKVYVVGKKFSDDYINIDSIFEDEVLAKEQLEKAKKTINGWYYVLKEIEIKEKADELERYWFTWVNSKNIDLNHHHRNKELYSWKGLTENKFEYDYSNHGGWAYSTISQAHADELAMNYINDENQKKVLKIFENVV